MVLISNTTCFVDTDLLPFKGIKKYLVFTSILEFSEKNGILSQPGVGGVDSIADSQFENNWWNSHVSGTLSETYKMYHGWFRSI